MNNSLSSPNADNRKIIRRQQFFLFEYKFYNNKSYNGVGFYILKIIYIYRRLFRFNYTLGTYI